MDLYFKNLQSEGVCEQDMKERVRAVNQMSRKSMDMGNVVIEVTRTIFDILMSEER